MDLETEVLGPFERVTETPRDLHYKGVGIMEEHMADGMDPGSI